MFRSFIRIVNNRLNTWLFRICYSVITKATKHPRVGGLYTLLSIILRSDSGDQVSTL